MGLTACMVGPNFQPPAPPAVDRYTPSSLPAQTDSGTSAQRFVVGAPVTERWVDPLFGSPPGSMRWRTRR